jgi:hypothetical protein
VLTGDLNHAEARTLFRNAIQRTAPTGPATVQPEARPIVRASIGDADEGATVPVPRIVLPPPKPASPKPQVSPTTPPGGAAPAGAAAPANPHAGSVLSKLKPWIIRGRNKRDG